MSLDMDRSTWPRVKFGEVVRNVNENVKDPEAAGIDRVIGLEHLDPGELRIDRWGDLTEETTFTRRVKPGQTLFGKRRAYQRKTAYSEFDAVCSGDILVFESADPDVLLPELLPFIAMTDGFYAKALETSAGSLSPRTRWSDLATYEFDLPPLADQRRIANLLWAIERHSREVSAEISAAHVTQATFVDRNFGVSRDSVMLSEWTGTDGIRIGPFGAQLHASDYQEQGIPVVMPQDMSGDRISESNIQRVSASKAEELSVHAVRSGDILLPRRGELDRRALVTASEEGWLCGTGSVRIRLKAGANPTAILLALAAPSTVEWLRQNASGTTMPNLNASIVSRIPITMPAAPRLASVLQAHDAIEAGGKALTQDLEALRSLRAAVLDEAFRGD